MNCTICNKQFESKRQDKKFCSSTCRSKASRATPLSVATATVSATDKLSVATDKPIDDFTRKMVEDNLTLGETFIPNWYTLGYKSRNEAKERMGWNRLMG